ncbi:hypothetical protein [Paenibacillus sp. 1A_MP2]
MKRVFMIALGAIFMFSNIESVSANEVRIETEVNEVIGTPYRLGDKHFRI